MVRSAAGAAALLLLCLAGAPALAGETRQHVDERTGLDAWVFEDTGIRVELIQRLPDQTRAFFLGRGFDQKAVDRIAARCVFQTIIRNTFDAGGPVLETRLAEWRALTPEGPRPLILKRHWQQEWEDRGVARSARIAFQWALFPTVQRFRPGDWNMGMTTYPVAPGTQLDVELAWHVGETLRRGRMTGMVCATNEMAPERGQ